MHGCPALKPKRKLKVDRAGCRTGDKTVLEDEIMAQQGVIDCFTIFSSPPAAVTQSRTSGTPCPVARVRFQRVLSSDEAAPNPNSPKSPPRSPDEGTSERPKPKDKPRPRLAQRNVRVLIVDDHPVFRQGLRSLLESLPTLEIVGEAATGWQTVQQARKLKPDIVLMDVSMPEMDGVAATKQIIAEDSCRDVVGLSMHRSEGMAQRMYDAGARTYLTKDQAIEQLLKTVRAFTGSRP